MNRTWLYLFMVYAVTSSPACSGEPHDAGGRLAEPRKQGEPGNQVGRARWPWDGKLADLRKQWETVALDELTSTNPAVLRRLRCLDATARKVAKPSWDYQPYHVLSPETILWRAWWATPAEAVTPLRFFTFDPPPKPDEERHSITIEAFRSRSEPHAVDEIYIQAYRLAKRGQWGAEIHYGLGEWNEGAKYGYRGRRRPFHADAFDLSFNLRKGELLADYRSRFGLREQLSRFAYPKVIGDVQYDILVALAPMANSDREVKPWFASAASLRECALKRLDELSQAVENKIPAYHGDGYYRQRIGDASVPGPAHLFPENSRSTQPQLILASFALPPRRSDRPMTTSEKLEVLQEARDELNRRRKLVMDHFREMYAALVETFPLGDCLE